MHEPIPGAAEAAAPPPGSVFTPQPSPAAPEDEAPPPAAGPNAYKQQAYAVMGSHHGINGRLDVLERRLADLLATHAALVAHITEQAPAASSSTPGGTAFWGRALDQHHIIHGLLKAAETEVASLLTAHGGLIGALELIL